MLSKNKMKKRKIQASSKIDFTFHVISICDNETHAKVDKNLTTSLNILHYYYTIVFLAITVWYANDTKRFQM